MQSYEVDEPRFWRPSTIAAGIILLLVLIAGVFVIAVRNGGGSSNHPAAQQPTPGSTQTSGTTGPPTPTTTASTASQCSLPAGDQSIPEATPQGITWSIYQTVVVPSSPTAGPQIVTGDIARCYAHNPVGALIAVSQISARYLIAPDWRGVVNAQVAPGPGMTAYITLRSQENTQGGNQPGDYSQLAGFKYVSYSPAAAVVELVTKSSEGAMQATLQTVDWIDGDWKLQLQPDGSNSPNALPVTSLVGFSTWAGV